MKVYIKGILLIIFSTIFLSQIFSTYNKNKQHLVQHKYLFYTPHFKEFKNYALDCVNIVKAVFKDQEHTAAITASSPWLVHHLTKFIPNKNAIHILEVGAATGVVTRKIIKRMHNQSTLDAVEYNPDLYVKLIQELGKEQNNRVAFYNAAIENWQSTHSTDNYYDMIISTIPTTQLPLKTLEQILNRYTTMLKPGGIFLYINLCGSSTLTLWTKELRYLTTRTIDNYLVKLNPNKQRMCKTDLKNYKKILMLLNDWRNTYFDEVSTEVIPLNIPPAWVMCLQKKS